MSVCHPNHFLIVIPSSKVVDDHTRVPDEAIDKLLCISRDDLAKQTSLKRKLDDLNVGLKVFDGLFLYN